MALTSILITVALGMQGFCNALPHLHGKKKHKGAHKKGVHAHKVKNATSEAAPIVSPSPEKLCTIMLPRHAVQADSQDDALGWLDKTFARQEESSYNIPEQDKKTILDSAVRFSKQPAVECSEDSYGEILQTSAVKLFAHPLVQLKPGETFADLGSGLGQLVMDAVLVGEAKRSVGVELSQSRSKESCATLQEVSKALPVTELSGWRATRHESQAEILSGDLFGLPDSFVNELNVVYVANLCFRPAMLTALAGKLEKALPEGARVASLRKFDGLSEKSRLKFQGTVDLPMSWSIPGYSQAVYVYKTENVQSHF